MEDFVITNRYALGIKLLVLSAAASMIMSCGQAGEIQTVDSLTASEKMSGNTDIAAIEDDIPNNNDGPTPIPTPTPTSSPNPNPSPNPIPTPTPPPTGGEDPAPPVSNPPGKGKKSKDADIVECMIGHPNVKVTLTTSSFVPGSNAVETRVCMSRNACLNIVNEYAAVRGCSLSKGGPTTPGLAGDQCTGIFPGSKGTCKNAKFLNDGAISTLLTEMAK